MQPTPATKKTKKKRKEKRNAVVLNRRGRQFWTTQTQFWEWVRNGIVVKLRDEPLTGTFVREHEESLVVINKTILNTAHPHHLREALTARRLANSAHR